MADIYIYIVVLLFILAIADLIVGVSNDAVNFLNSSIGSKVASRKVIMIVASLGILAGATFSSGMMEVARKGIFQPEFFFFSELIIVFAAVMITDIILLDLFNTFGMPTSTTVSIVFELLGAAVAVALLKILTAGDAINSLGDYINTSSALLIISGIFLSVGIAFVVGIFVQFLSRWLFSFQLDKRMKWVGGLWSGLALAALTYFLLIKGMKGASFISDDFITWVKENTLTLLLGAFICWSVILQLCMMVFKINILRIVVLFGTFALAMAFAGNDLVNFIGVPIAGLESYLAWSSSNVAPDQYAMSVLNEPVRTETYMLVIAGAIMVLTLWFSKKARSVTETEVNLGRQDEGAERFRPNALAKGIVRYTLMLNEGVSRIIPAAWRDSIAKNFEEHQPPVAYASAADQPAFDLVRASVNLTVASVLIAFATSLKLPLSTTYVSFMVAMGTSLSDNAWGRSSAVFRVAGVLNVIGGWFFTAFMAFTAAATFATIIFYFGIWGVLALVLLVITLVSRTFMLHRKKQREKEKQQHFEEKTSNMDTAGVIEQTAENVTDILSIVRGTYMNSLGGVIREDRNSLQKTTKEIVELKREIDELSHQLFGLIKRIEEDDSEASRLYIMMYDLEQDIVQSTHLIASTCTEYVNNSLQPIKNKFGNQLEKLAQDVDEYLAHLIEIIQQQPQAPNTKFDRKHEIFLEIEMNLADMVKRIKSKEYGLRESRLLLSILLETKDLIAVASRFAKVFHRTQPLVNGDSDKGETTLYLAKKGK